MTEDLAEYMQLFKAGAMDDDDIWKIYALMCGIVRSDWNNNANDWYRLPRIEWFKKVRTFVAWAYEKGYEVGLILAVNNYCKATGKSAYDTLLDVAMTLDCCDQMLDGENRAIATMDTYLEDSDSFPRHIYDMGFEHGRVHLGLCDIYRKNKGGKE